MRGDIVEQISDPENRIQEASEFFGWPKDLVQYMFMHSKAYFEGPWERFYPEHVDEYYASGFYTIRQLSYSRKDIFTEEISKFLDQVDGSCLDYACGVGDYAMYLAMCGHKIFVKEHCGIPTEFLKFRFKKYGLLGKIEICIPLKGAVEALPQVEYTLLVSAVDHIDDPVSFVNHVCKVTKKDIFATPCIDENYDRPTHIKSILKDVPAAFEVINEHNRKLKS